MSVIIRLFPFSCALLFLFICGATGAVESRMTGDVSIHTAWAEVVLMYPRAFFLHRKQSLPEGCAFINSSRACSDSSMMTVHCREKIQLIRPAWRVKQWQQQQKTQGYVLFHFPEMGISNVKAVITTIKSSSFNPDNLNLKTAARPVIGIFIRHASDVRRYTFIDGATGQLSHINATPNHLFYVANRHQYIPVSEVSSTDQLVADAGNSVQLVCHSGQRSHCGELYRGGKLTKVYNLEVYQKHTYLVGNPGIKVHNTYTCPACGKKFDTAAQMGAHWPEQHPGEKSLTAESLQALDKLSVSSRFSFNDPVHIQYELRGGDATLSRVWFSPDKWVIRAIYREDKSVPYFANDLIRYSYFKASYLSMLYLRSPKNIVVEFIENTEALEALGSEDSGQMERFEFTAFGKFISSVQQDFGFRANGIEFNKKTMLLDIPVSPL